MPSRSRLLAALLLLAPAAPALAQSNYQPGYVLSLSGDTLRGSVNYRQWLQNPNTVEFRPVAPPGATRVYRSTDVRGFGVAGERYESAVVQVDASPYKTSELSTSSAFQMRQDSVFLRTLVSGPKSLYYYQDRNSKEHFFIRQANRIDLLIYKQYLQSSTVRSNKGYLGQLQLYLADCPKVTANLSRVAYTQPSLQELFAAYYACTSKGPGPEFQQKIEKTQFAFGLLLGANATFLETRAYRGNSFLQETIRFDGSMRPTGGLTMEVVLPRRLHRFSLNNELVYFGYKATSQSTTTYGPDSYNSSDIQLDYQYLRYNGMLRYLQPLTTDLGLFANAGFISGYAFKAASSRKQVIRFNTSETTTTTTAFDNEDRLEQGMLLGLGLRYQRLSGEARYERGNAMLEGIFQSSKTTSYYFLLGYRF